MVRYDTRILSFAGMSIPLLAPSGAPSWAIANLVLASLEVFFAAVVCARVLYRTRRGPLSGRRGRGPERGGGWRAFRGVAAKAQLRPSLLATAIGLAAVGAGLFAITQDVGGGVMTLLDGNTPTLAIILAAEVAAAAFVFRARPAAPQLE